MIFEDDDDLDDEIVAGESDEDLDREAGVHGGWCCDDKWTGGRPGHCGSKTQKYGCHRTFFGEDAWDSHFVGPPTDRRCRTPEEMEAGGMWPVINQFGTTIWHGHWNKAGVQKRRPAETIKKG